jgi:hypothetical protein
MGWFITVCRYTLRVVVQMITLLRVEAVVRGTIRHLCIELAELVGYLLPELVRQEPALRTMVSHIQQRD